MQTIPNDWLDLIIAETARRCIDEANEATGPLGIDSSAVETTRYEAIVKPNVNERDFVEQSQRTYWKYHITAILGLQIILSAITTPSNVSDTTMLPATLADIKRGEFDFTGYTFDCDKGYDSDHNCKLIFEMGMTPNNNIKQRKNTVSRGKPDRKKAAGLFDEEKYKNSIRRCIRGGGDQRASIALPIHSERQP